MEELVVEIRTADLGYFFVKVECRCSSLVKKGGIIESYLIDILEV